MSMSLEKAWNEILKRKIMTDHRQRQEYYFLTELLKLTEDLISCEIDNTARDIIHIIIHRINEYEQKSNLIRRKEDENSRMDSR